MALPKFFPRLLLVAVFGHILAVVVVMANSETTQPTSTTMHRNHNSIERRQLTTTEMSTCGYYSGDMKKPRTANSGYNCRVDTKNALWGFCPTTVINPSDCGLAGSCRDRKGCKNGCWDKASSSLTTAICSGDQYCSLALLAFGPDQTFSYIACGAAATTDIYLASATKGTTKDSITGSEKPSFKSVSSTSVAPHSTTSTTIDGSTSELRIDTSIGPSQPTSRIGIETQTSPLTASTNDIAASMPESGERNIPVGPIVGGVLGGLVIICATVVSVVYLRRHSRRKLENGLVFSNRNSKSIVQYPSAQDPSGPQILGLHELSADQYARQNLVPAELEAR